MIEIFEGESERGRKGGRSEKRKLENHGVGKRTRYIKILGKYNT